MHIKIGHRVRQGDMYGTVIELKIIYLKNAVINARIEWDGAPYKTWEPLETLEVISHLPLHPTKGN